MMEKRWKWIQRVFFVLLFLFAGTIHAQAASLEPSGDTDGKEDYRNIMEALQMDGEVRLESGNTYYIAKPIILSSNQTIYADGAAIICLQGAFRSDLPTKTNYASVKNVTVDGGTWKNVEKDGLHGSMIQFSHGQNITLKNLDVSCNYDGHAMELIAVKDVLVDHCTVKALGQCAADCREEQIQIDIATPATAPKVAAAGARFVQGQTCQNITIKNCTVLGARGVCANFTKTENGKYLNKFHKNIVIQNNNIEGRSAEALALFNVIGATVTGNKIITKNENVGESYSVGLHAAIFGKAPKSMGSAVFTINSNVIKGGRQGMLFWSHSSSKFGRLVAKKNKCYARSGKEQAYQINHVKKQQISGNKKYKW